LAAGQVELDKHGYILADETTKTSIPGVFAAGDVRTKPLRQIVTAAADGASASMFAEEYVKREIGIM
jgi:thioredoxin reductase (NADPH)